MSHRLGNTHPGSGPHTGGNITRETTSEGSLRISILNSGDEEIKINNNNNKGNAFIPLGNQKTVSAYKSHIFLFSP